MATVEKQTTFLDTEWKLMGARMVKPPATIYVASVVEATGNALLLPTRIVMSANQGMLAQVVAEHNELLRLRREYKNLKEKLVETVKENEMLKNTKTETEKKVKKVKVA